MKHSEIIAVSFVGLSALAVGCGSSSVSTTPAQAPTAATPTASAQKAGVGDTINISDSASGDTIAVTLVKVVDPDSTTDGFNSPPAGDRYESIQFRVVNKGTGTYQDDPLSDVSATDAAGQTMQQDIFVSSTTAGEQMSSSVNLVPGGVALGYVTFDVPSGDKIAQAQYSISGLVSSTGQWQVGNGQAGPPAAPPSKAPPSSAAAAPPPPPPAANANSAQAVVEQYFAAINAGNYELAWSLGGKNIEQGSYNSFVQGFSGTSSDSVTIVSTSGDTVSITLDAAQTDGTHKYFAGTYTVQNGAIVSADIH